MDRVIVYPGAIPLDTDELNTNRNTLVAFGALIQAVFGTTTFVSGLACLPTTPTANLVVNVQPGAIGFLSTVDATAYGSLAINSSALMKMGINLTTTQFTITPPATSSYSQNYLIEAQLLEADGTAVVLPYYNASNPASPYSGPSNSGTAQNTIRTERVSLQLKAGTAAPAGTQTTPSTDSGWVPLYVISVNNGQTQITSTSIAVAPGAPFIGSLLTQGLIKLQSNLTLYVSTSGNDTTGNGLLPSTAFATLQGAWNYLINNYNLNGYNVQISVGTGTFAGLVANGSPQGLGSGNSISIVGSGYSSTTIAGVSAAGISVGAGASITISAVTITGLNGLQANAQGSILIGSGCAFGNCTNSLWWADGGQIFCANSITILATTFAQAFFASLNGLICFNGTCVITQSSAATFTTYAFARGGQISISSSFVSISAPASTGTKYACIAGGIIDTAGGGASFFPGGTAGSAASGFYV